MEYVKVKNADKIIDSSSYVIKNPEKCKNRWNEIFGNKNLICLELGMGRGDFIIEMAKKYPNRNFVGLELNESQMATAVKNIGSMNLPNLKLLCMDASKIDLVFGKEIDTIYLTFSEPWPKKIDEKKRFTHLNYLKLYDKVFRKNKHIILKTDNRGLFTYSLQSLSQYWYVFERVSLDLHNEENPIVNVMTNYEKQYFKEGRPIYYLDASFYN